MTTKLLSPMRVHCDITCLHPASEDVRWAFTPRTFELPFSHQVALFVSLSLCQSDPDFCQAAGTHESLCIY